MDWPITLLAIALSLPHILYMFIWFRPNKWRSQFKHPIDTFAEVAVALKGAMLPELLYRLHIVICLNIYENLLVCRQLLMCKRMCTHVPTAIVWDAYVEAQHGFLSYDQ